MTVKFGVLADAANTTADGRLNLLGVFTTLSAASLPARHPAMTLVATVDPTLEDIGATFLFDLLWVDPDGITTEIGRNQPFSVPPGPPPAPQCHLLYNLFDFAIHKYGPHCFRLILHGALPYDIPVEVRPRR